VSTDAALGWDELSKHGKRWGHVQWLLNASVEGDTKALLKAKLKAFTSIFRSVLGSGEHLIKISSLRSRAVRAISQFLPRPLAGLMGQLVDVFYEHTPLLGHPIERPLRTVYWALPHRDSNECKDLHGDSVGLLWVSVPVPLRKNDINEVCSIIDNGLLAFGFEPSTQVTLVSERLGRVITALMYDRLQPGQDTKAIECQQSVYDELRRRGHYTYRLQSHLMEEYANYGTAHQLVSARIKKTLDPEDILDPSRYPATSEPRGTRGSEA